MSAKKIHFFKYQGTGNDFVIIDNRTGVANALKYTEIQKICSRRFGVGADGLIFLEDDISSDFKMVYFNADGHQSTMCGNGGRCIVQFAMDLGIINKITTFTAIDGLHEAYIESKKVYLKMSQVDEIITRKNAYFLNTGSPHHVQIVHNLDGFDVKNEGARLRYGLYGQIGSNINFIEAANEQDLFIRTYERGVEEETFSCGTGAVAAAICWNFMKSTHKSTITLKTKGGILEVSFKREDDSYKDIVLSGPAQFVYEGFWK